MDTQPTKPTAAQLRALGISQPFAWQLANGTHLPSLKLAQRIEQELGFPAGAWQLKPQAGEQGV